MCDGLMTERINKGGAQAERRSMNLVLPSRWMVIMSLQTVVAVQSDTDFIRIIQGG